MPLHAIAHIEPGEQTVSAVYAELVGSGALQRDPHQERVAALLDAQLTLLDGDNGRGETRWWQSPPFIPPRWRGGIKGGAPNQGLYIYGTVGRGKSLLMDIFFHLADVKRKWRIHFHAFMLEVHKRLHQLDTRTDNALMDVAEQIAEQNRLLCFDEFQVHDIADAMLLSRLFQALFAHDVRVVTTSNRVPEDLYLNGLHRDRFLPFIDLLKERLEVTSLAGELDYRKQHLQQLQTTYFTPLGKKAERFLENVFADLTQGGEIESGTLDVNGRTLTVPKMHGDTAWFSFSELCEKPLGAADYIAIAEQFSCLLLADIPKLSKAKRNEAKRFVTLIDALYEHKTKLICTAAVLPDKIYPKGDVAFEFERTVSRLNEMQSEAYFGAEHHSRTT